MANTRSEMKHYLLKQIMMRFDFEGLLESDVEKCIANIRETLFKAGYINFSKRQENKIDFQIRTDLNVQVENPLLVNNFNHSEVYSFSTNQNEIIEINMRFITLTVNIDKEYVSFDAYVELMTRLIIECKRITQYFKMIRFGLRKVNVVFLDELSDINDYFIPASINSGEIITKFNDYQYKASNITNLLVKDLYKINYIRNIQEGIMQNDNGTQRTSYQVVIDIDIYKDDLFEMINIFTDEKSVKNLLIEANSELFAIYIRTLQPSFIENLKKSEFDDEKITGVI